jgi:hypothetical protein
MLPTVVFYRQPYRGSSTFAALLSAFVESLHCGALRRVFSPLYTLVVQHAILFLGAPSMALTISLPDDAESRLRERARAAGQDVTQYVEQLITKELVAPLSLAEAAEPLARAVDAAGVTDDAFTSILVDARDAVRRDRHKPA